MKFDLVLLTNTFPQLSETFIFRKAYALANQGHRVHIIASLSGNWKAFSSYDPLPITMTVSYIGEIDISSKRQISVLLVSRLVTALKHSPFRVLHLLAVCILQRHATLRERISAIIKHLPLLQVNSDVIHCEFLGVAANFPLLNRITKIPLVLSCRGADLHLLEQYPVSRQKLYIRTLQNANAIHCVSDEMGSEVTRISGRDHDIWINRPAVHIESITPRKQIHNIRRPVLISIGRAVWKKGFDYLLNALLRLKEGGVSFTMQIIGGGYLLPAFRMLVVDMGLSEYVEFVGAITPTEVLMRLKAADIFILSSVEEGISNAVLEAMATGLPVITTDAGGMSEAVRDGIDGYIVPARDSAAMADRIMQLIQDPVKRLQMGTTARRQVEENFSIYRQIQVFEQMYSSVTGKDG